ISDSLFRRTRWFGLALGIWLGGIGLFDILSNAGVTTLTGRDFLHSAWPLLLIAVGAKVLFGRTFRWHPGKVKLESRTNVVGEFRYGQSNWLLDKDLDLEHGVGDVKIDLTTAEITEGIHNIHVNAWIGEILIRVPDNVSVSVDTSANIGELDVLGENRSGFNLALQKQEVVADSPVELRIDARLGIGSLRVVKRPAVQRFTL
ncbi:MAG: cell wall-active antibiotics response protein LiaF, partial [Mycobacterium leprae]